MFMHIWTNHFHLHIHTHKWHEHMQVHECVHVSVWLSIHEHRCIYTDNVGQWHSQPTAASSSHQQPSHASTYRHVCWWSINFGAYICTLTLTHNHLLIHAYLTVYTCYMCNPRCLQPFEACSVCDVTNMPHTCMPVTTHSSWSDVRPLNTPAGTVAIWLLESALLRHAHTHTHTLYIYIYKHVYVSLKACM